MINCIIVGLGGFLGAVLRYLIGLLPVNTQNGFPVKTLGINIVGAFVIGLVVALGAKKEWNKTINFSLSNREQGRTSIHRSV